MPEASTLLGFDFGLRRIGLAVGQAITATASPLDALPARDGKPDWEALARLIDSWRPQALVVGLPYNLDGSRQEMTRLAERFSRQLHGRFGLPVHLVDERLSSVEAERRLKALRQAGRKRLKKTDIDSAAACILLESWLRGEGRGDDDTAGQ